MRYQDNMHGPLQSSDRAERAGAKREQVVDDCRRSSGESGSSESGRRESGSGESGSSERGTHLETLLTTLAVEKNWGQGTGARHGHQNICSFRVSGVGR